MNVGADVLSALIPDVLVGGVGNVDPDMRGCSSRILQRRSRPTSTVCWCRFGYAVQHVGLPRSRLVLCGRAHCGVLCCRCFCLRPIFQQKYQAQPEKGALDSIGLFFNVCSVSVVILPPFVFMLEGSLLMPELNKLAAAGTLWTFAWNVALSSLFFFLYQFTQLLVSFSILDCAQHPLV